MREAVANQTIPFDAILFTFRYMGIYISTFMAPRVILYLYTKGMSIQKKSKYDNWMLSHAPFIEKRSVSELQGQVNFKKVEALMPYVEKLEEYTSIMNMKNVYRNLTTVHIKKASMLQLLAGVAGTHNGRKNTVTFLSKSDLGHEFLHLASSTYDEERKIEYSGFSQIYKKHKVMGNGLNEGYTELLASRIYNKDKKVEAYKNLVRIASLFEYFFDDPKDMEDYYFNYDLPGFIKYMEKFASRKDIIEILIMMDVLLMKTKLTLNFLPSLNEFRIKMKLYEIFKRNCQDPYKLNAFKKQLESSSLLIRMTMNSKKFSLQRENPYVKMDGGSKTK